MREQMEPTIMQFSDGIHVVYFTQTLLEPAKTFQYTVLDKISSIKVGRIDVDVETGIASFIPLLKEQPLRVPQLNSLTAIMKSLGWEKQRNIFRKNKPLG